jgi:hypothetical protein
MDTPWKRLYAELTVRRCTFRGGFSSGKGSGGGDQADGTPHQVGAALPAVRCWKTESAGTHSFIHFFPQQNAPKLFRTRMNKDVEKRLSVLLKTWAFMLPSTQRCQTKFKPLILWPGGVCVGFGSAFPSNVVVGDSLVTFPELEAHFAEILALILLVLGGVRLILHEWQEIAEAWRKLRKHGRNVIPNSSP